VDPSHKQIGARITSRVVAIVVVLTMLRWWAAGPVDLSAGSELGFSLARPRRDGVLPVIDASVGRGTSGSTLLRALATTSWTGRRATITVISWLIRCCCMGELISSCSPGLKERRLEISGRQAESSLTLVARLVLVLHRSHGDLRLAARRLESGRWKEDIREERLVETARRLGLEDRRTRRDERDAKARNHFWQSATAGESRDRLFWASISEHVRRLVPSSPQ
jgi:hypothetical protein